nr:hypothetical protein [Tanacetum cinerariifolium]
MVRRHDTSLNWTRETYYELCSALQEDRACRGSGVGVVEWSRKWGRGGNSAGGKNRQGAIVVSILNVGKIRTLAILHSWSMGLMGTDFVSP